MVERVGNNVDNGASKKNDRMNGPQITALAEEIRQFLSNEGLPLIDLKAACQLAWLMDKRFYEVVMSEKSPLSYDQVTEIFRKYNSEGGYTLEALANIYGVSSGTIHKIVKGKYW